MIPPGNTLTIVLNGNDIDRDMETAAANGNVITNNGTLTITGNGTVTINGGEQCGG
ncbi:MAG: hypothetical protein IIY42_05400 [Ruminococcus sp.]|nr:hypothetical protein [Ruminococcus sp.]